MPLVTMSIQKQLAFRIRNRRRRLRLTQAELAAKAGTSQTAIARLEGAHGNPSADLMQRVVDALDFDVIIYVRPQKLPEFAPPWMKKD